MKKPPAKRTPKSKDETIEIAISERRSSWVGPLPPPSTLDEFNDVVENGAERIVAAWEKETEHRHKMETRELSIVSFDAILGKVFAFLFVLSSLALAAYCASVGAEWLGAIIGGGVIASVVWAFVKNLNIPKTK